MLFLLLLAGGGCTAPPAPGIGSGLCAVACKGEVMRTYPHDPSAFTEGLFLDGSKLYESTGLAGQSTLRRSELATGAIEALRPMDALEYGEGLAAAQGSIVQLTWRNGSAHVYDKGTFALTDTWSYPTEGWGLTFDGTRFIMSDGSATLRFRSPADFAELGSVLVHDASGPVAALNELEYIQGFVYANVWRTDMIAIIDPQSGEVRGRLDLTGLWPIENRSSDEDVLNGIAYMQDTGNLLVTGKRWPSLFEIIPRPLP